MEQGFKIKYKIVRGEKQDIPPIMDFKGIPLETVIYEGSTAYLPRFNDQGDILRYSVYFWSRNKYWRFVNNCSITTFENYIRPRLPKESFVRKVLRTVKNFNEKPK